MIINIDYHHPLFNHHLYFNHTSHLKKGGNCRVQSEGMDWWIFGRFSPKSSPPVSSPPGSKSRLAPRWELLGNHTLVVIKHSWEITEHGGLVRWEHPWSIYRYNVCVTVCISMYRYMASWVSTEKKPLGTKIVIGRSFGGEHWSRRTRKSAPVSCRSWAFFVDPLGLCPPFTLLPFVCSFYQLFILFNWSSLVSFFFACASFFWFILFFFPLLFCLQSNQPHTDNHSQSLPRNTPFSNAKLLLNVALH